MCDTAGIEPALLYTMEPQAEVDLHHYIDIQFEFFIIIYYYYFLLHYP